MGSFTSLYWSGIACTKGVSPRDENRLFSICLTTPIDAWSWFLSYRQQYSSFKATLRFTSHWKLSNESPSHNVQGCLMCVERYGFLIKGRTQQLCTLQYHLPTCWLQWNLAHCSTSSSNKNIFITFLRYSARIGSLTYRRSSNATGKPG